MDPWTRGNCKIDWCKSQLIKVAQSCEKYCWPEYEGTHLSKIDSQKSQLIEDGQSSEKYFWFINPVDQ
jgi:hypothetical protein